MEWNEWQKKANSSYKKGSYTVQNMIQDWGFPTDLDPNKIQLLFRKGKVGTKSLKSRQASKIVNGFTRKRAEKITLPEHKNDPENKKQLRLQKQQRAEANRVHGRGSHHLDHRFSQNKLNQATSGQGPRLRNKTIRGIEARVGHPVGEHYLNKELVRAEINQARNEADLAKNPPKRISKAPDYLKNIPKNLRLGASLIHTALTRHSDPIQTGVDLFMQGQSGSALDQALNSIPDTSETDLGRHVGQAIADKYSAGLELIQHAISTKPIPTVGRTRR